MKTNNDNWFKNKILKPFTEWVQGWKDARQNYKDRRPWLFYYIDAETGQKEKLPWYVRFLYTLSYPATKIARQKWREAGGEDPSDWNDRLR